MEQVDSLVDVADPLPRELRPIPPLRHPPSRQLLQLPGDLFEAHANSLGEDDEGDPPEDRPRITPMTGTGPLGLDETLLLVETKR